MDIKQLFTEITAAELCRRINATRDPATGRVRKITQQGIGKWVKVGRVPADRCIVVEKVLGGRVTRYQMRPDVYGEDPALRAA